MQFQYSAVYIGDTIPNHYSRSVMKEIEAGLGDIMAGKAQFFYNF